MIEALFATQQSWATSGIDDKDKLFSIASREGSLSKDEFNRCLADRDLLDKIVADRNYAYETLKVDEAPTFFVRFGARRQWGLQAVRCSYGLISSCVSSAGRSLGEMISDRGLVLLIGMCSPVFGIVVAQQR
jgi:hypothetical protein